MVAEEAGDGDVLAADDDGDEGDADGGEESDEQMIAFLHAVLTNPEALHSLPDSLMRDLIDVAGTGVLPFELCQIIRAEAERRKKH